MSVPDWDNLQPIAHRGLHDAENGIIENSRSAINAAIKADYAIEIDVQRSADLQPMVFHDPSLDQLTAETGKLVERTADELRDVRFKNTSDYIMTLSELLETLNGQVPLFIEIKSGWGDVGPFEQSIIRTLEGYQGQVAIMSFDAESIAYFRNNAPQITRGVVAAPYIPRGIIADGFLIDEKNRRFPSLRRFSMRHLLHWIKTRPNFVCYNVNYLNYPAPRIVGLLDNIPLLAWTVKYEGNLSSANLASSVPIFEGLRP